MEQQSEHPYAQAIKRYAEEERIRPTPVRNFEVAPGKGLRGSVEQEDKWHPLCIGNLVWLYENEISQTDIPEALLWDADGREETALWVALDQKVVGVLFLADKLREEAEQ